MGTGAYKGHVHVCVYVISILYIVDQVCNTVHSRSGVQYSSAPCVHYGIVMIKEGLGFRIFEFSYSTFMFTPMLCA